MISPKYKALLVCLTVLLSVSAFCAEKGGSGTEGEAKRILEDYEITKICPDVPPEKLCRLIDAKRMSTDWLFGMHDLEQQNEEDFFTNCCSDFSLNTPSTM